MYKWISCNEQMPKPNETVGAVYKYYLIQNEFDDMMVASFREDAFGKKYWEQMYRYEPITDKVVAWMELPEKYRENEHSN